MSIRFTSLALAALLAGSVAACTEDTSQPDVGEAFADITSGEESADGTSTATETTEPAPAPKTAEQADAEEAKDITNRASRANDRFSKSPLKGD